jgi:hypothetical protein
MRTRIALLIVAIASVAVVTALRSRPWTSSQEPSTKTETRDVGPSGQPGPIDVIVPNLPDDPAEPKVSGPFRLVPFGYTGDVSTQQPGEYLTGSAWQKVDLASATFSTTITYVPAGFAYAPPRAGVVRNGIVQAVEWTFSGAGASTIQVTRGVRELPFDVRVPPSDSWLELKQALVGDARAVLLQSKPAQGGPQAVYVAEGRVVTEIIGDVADIRELLKIAESIE